VLGLGNSLSSGGASSEFSILDTSPELWWKFNTGQSAADQDADGDADVLWTDQAGNYNGVGGNTGSTIVDIKEGSFSSGAWLSADDSDFLRVGDESLNLTDDFTIFIIFTNHNADDTFLGGDDDFMRFGLSSNAAKARFRFGDDGNSNQDDFNFDTNPSTGKQLFKIQRLANDTMVMTQNSTTTLLAAVSCQSESFGIKRGPFGASGIADGSLYELVIYNRAVTAAETALIEADILTRNSLTED